MTSLCDGTAGFTCNNLCGCTVQLVIGHGVLDTADALEKLTATWRRILLVSDENTHEVCGHLVQRQLAAMGKLTGLLVYPGQGLLVPDDAAVARLEAAAGCSSGQHLPDKTEKSAPDLPDLPDLIVGVGAGVINDLCKYVSHKLGLPYLIVATAPSMDGYLSSGAALILGGSKITMPAAPPVALLADTNVLRHAPMRMIRAGYGDIIGKYSSLNDWKLNHLLTGTAYCPYVALLTRNAADEVAPLGKQLLARDEKSVETLMQALLQVGVAMSEAGNSHCASGSEHHLAHFLELTGIDRKKLYLLHGLDVGYCSVITAMLRERMAMGSLRPFTSDRPGQLRQEVFAVFGKHADAIWALEKERLSNREIWEKLSHCWPQVCGVLRQAPGSVAIMALLESAGYVWSDFLAYYGEAWLAEAVAYARFTKNYDTLLRLVPFAEMKMPDLVSLA